MVPTLVNQLGGSIETEKRPDAGTMSWISLLSRQGLFGIDSPGMTMRTLWGTGASWGRTGPRFLRSRSAAWACPGMYGPADEKRKHRHHPRGARARRHAARHRRLLRRGAQRAADRPGAARAAASKALLSVKFGALRGPDGSWLGIDTRPAAVKNFVAYRLPRLGVDHIDIYRPARLDPAVPIEDTIGAIADLVKAGYVRHIGLSEVGVETIRRAHAVHPIVDLQIEYSLISRGPEADDLPGARASSASAHRVRRAVARAARGRASRPAPGDFRAHLPRFSGEKGEKNQRWSTTLARLAREQGVDAGPARHRLGARQGAETIVPRDRRAHARRSSTDALGALAGRAHAERARPQIGGRAGRRGRRHALRREQMAMLDSER